MAFNDNLAMYVVATDGATWTDEETSNGLVPANAAKTGQTDGDGEYYEKDSATASGYQDTNLINITNGLTIAIRFRSTARTNNYHFWSIYEQSGGGRGIRARSDTSPPNTIMARAASDNNYNAEVPLINTYPTGTMCSLVMSYASDGSTAAGGGGFRIWEAGVTHSGTDPDLTADSTFQDNAARPTDTFGLFSTSRCNVYELAVWSYRVPDADCAAIIEDLSAAIRGRTFTPGGGPTGPIEASTTNLPQNPEGSIWTYDAAVHWGARGGGALTFSAPVNFPTGLTLASNGEISADGTTPEGSYGALGYTCTETGGTADGTAAASPFSLVVTSAGVVIQTQPAYDANDNLITGRTASRVRFISCITGNEVWVLTNHAMEPDGSFLFSSTGGELVSGQWYYVFPYETNADPENNQDQLFAHAGRYKAT